MFVIRIEDDEALTFRVFGKLQGAKDWICALTDEDVSDWRIDLYEVPGAAGDVKAVEAVRDGHGRHVAVGGNLIIQDMRHRSSFLAGMGIGTGAGF